MNEYYQNTECEVDSITHNGIIKDVDDLYYYVSIVAQSACVSCQVKGACNVTDMQEEIIEVPVEGNRIYDVGDRVEIIMGKSMGKRAVFLGYILPFIVLLATLIISLNLFDDEGIAGLIAFGILIPYYFILYLFKDKLRNSFEFRLR
jgi:sigma-E factor negative regulatory protein RseC